MLLLAVRDEKGVMLVPSPGKVTPGIVFNVKGGTPIHDQLMAVAEPYVGAHAKLDVNQSFADEFTLPDNRMATLYVATSGGTGPISEATSWTSIPGLLRAMPSDRSRLPFMRAWQVLSGGLSVNVKAIAGDDADKLLREYEESE